MLWENYDIGEEGLAWALARSPCPQLFQELVHLSRSHFGWFSKHLPRAFEYPWVFTEIGNGVGKSVLDIGAGVSPLPLLLAQGGQRVVTVDGSTIIRRLGQGQAHWNEWGYFDYACLDVNISSINGDILAVSFANYSFDCIYSVSVVEHLPALVRRKLWSKVKQWLSSDGVLLITVDLFPGTEQLWNYNQGKIVEPVEEHGDLDALEAELSQVGFSLAQRKILCDLRDSRTDCALLRFVQIDKSTGHLKEKYSTDYFLGGVDAITGRTYGVLGHSKFRAGKLHERHGQEFEFTCCLAETLTGKDVLEIGFGRGDLIPLFLGAGVSSYTGLDFSRAAVEIAKTHFNDRRLRLFQRAATQLDAEGAFDLIGMYDTIEHIPVCEMEAVWPKIYRAMRPRGYVIITTPIFDNPNVADHSEQIPSVSGMHCHKQTWGTLARSSLKHGFTIAHAAAERMLGLVRTEDLPLFDNERREQYLATQSALLARCGVKRFDGKLTPSIERALVPGAGRVLMGCVAENNSKYLSQALRLLQSVRWFGGDMAGVNFYVCVVGNVEPGYVREFERLGAFVRVVPPFDGRHPPSNKLRLFELPEIKAYDTVMLLDCDTIVVQDPWPFLDGRTFQAKMADLPTVPHEVFKRLFQHFDIKMPGQDYQCNPSGAPTICYCNGGVLIFPQQTLSDIVSAWRHFNSALLERLDLLGTNTFYCEQASLSLAFAAQPVPFSELPLSMNFPLHLTRMDTPPAMHDCDPVILHYHDRVDDRGYLQTSPYPGAQRRIEQFKNRVEYYRDQLESAYEVSEIGRIHLQKAFKAYWHGDTVTGREELTYAIKKVSVLRSNPQALVDEIVNRTLLFATNNTFDDRNLIQLARMICDGLPESIDSKRVRRLALVTLHEALVFRCQRRGAPREARSHALRAIALDRRLLLNRGLISVLIESFVGSSLMKRLRTWKKRSAQAEDQRDA